MTEKKTASKKLKALKDFHLFHPPHINVKIKKGDDLASIPKIYHDNLRTERVLRKEK